MSRLAGLGVYKLETKQVKNGIFLSDVAFGSIAFSVNVSA